MFPNYEYFICTGDFNAMTADEYTVFLNAGYDIANGGSHGTFYTCNDAPNAFTCDQIICSNNLKMLNVQMHPDRELSDHRLIVADIVIYN